MVSVDGSEIEDPVIVAVGGPSLMGVIWWVLERVVGSHGGTDHSTTPPAWMWLQW